MLVAKLIHRQNEPWPPWNANTLLYISWQMVFLHVQLQDKSVKNPGKLLQQQNLRNNKAAPHLHLRHQLHENRTKLYGRVLMKSMEPLRHNSPLSWRFFLFSVMLSDFKIGHSSESVIVMISPVSSV